MAKKSKKELFDSSDDDDDDNEARKGKKIGSDNNNDNGHQEEEVEKKRVGILKVNKKFAKEFNERKQREELARYNHSKHDEEESSSDDESDEDEFAELLTPQLDIKIFQTINAIRRGDERLYNPNINIFDDDAATTTATPHDDDNKEKQQKKKTHYKDLVRDQILKQMDNDDATNEFDNVKEENNNDNDGDGVQKLAYDEEQRQIRESFLKSAHDDNDTDDDALLVVKEGNVKKNMLFMDPQDEELLRKEIETMQNQHDPNGDILQDPRGEITDGNKFLRDYMLERKWVDKSELLEDDDDDDDDDDDEAASPNAKRASSNTTATAAKHFSGDNINTDDEESSLEDLNRMDEFESKYNFRFEEAIAENDTSRYNIVSYARGRPADSLRRIDDTRKKKRVEKEERKAAERKAKEEQLRRLKNAKKMELETKLNTIRSVASSQQLDEETLAKLMEGEYDPENFSKIMEDAYGDDFYTEEDAVWKTDMDVKQSMVTDQDLADEYYTNDENNDYYDDDGAYEENNNDEHDPTNAETTQDDGYHYDDDGEHEAEEEEENELEKQLKQKMLDELYKLDYEDIIGDMPCRFKYRNVEPNSYGLSCEEILFANDTKLKQFVSLKTMNPYRDNGEYRVTANKRKKFRELLKEDYEMLQKEKQGGNKTDNDNTAADATTATADQQESSDIKIKKRRRQKKGQKDCELTMSGDVADSVINEPSDVQVQSSQQEVNCGVTLKHKTIPESCDLINIPTTTAEILVSVAGLQKKQRKKRKRDKSTGANDTKKSTSTISGVSASRLSSYGVV